MRRLFLGLALFPLTCRKPAQVAADVAGTVAVTWAGSAKGRFAAPAAALWCRTDSLLEVLATRHDTGVGFTVIAQDSVRVAQYPVVSAAVQANWRPLGYAALRVATDSALRGYEATSGLINVTGLADGTVTGTLDLRLKRADGPDTVRIGGKFTRLRIVSAQGPCGRVVRPAPAPPPRPAVK